MPIQESATARLRRSRAKLKYLIENRETILIHSMGLAGLSKGDEGYSDHLQEVLEAHRLNIQSAIEDYSRGIAMIGEQMPEDEDELSDDIIELMGL